VRGLKKASLLSFDESAISVLAEPLDGSWELTAVLASGRSARRPVPVPRTLLRVLAQSTEISLIKAALLYCIRGLTIARRGGDISAKGSVKASWITGASGLSLRSVRSARARLLVMGWLLPGTGRSQLGLNRHGAYFEINLGWRPRATAGASAAQRDPWLTSDLRSTGRPEAREFAPPAAQMRAVFAPPYETKKTSSNEESRNQKTHRPERPGVYSKGAGKAKATIRNVTAADLESFTQTEELFRQAVAAGLVEASEAGAINFLAAACRAKAVEGNPPRVFMGIVRRRLWHHITQADEDRALAALRRYREEDPGRFRLLPRQNHGGTDAFPDAKFRLSHRNNAVLWVGVAG
jgi:hypothetical protein